MPPLARRLTYLADMVVNGPNHPGAVGLPPTKLNPAVPVFEHLEGKPLEGWRDVIVKEGPEGWARAVRSHSGLLLTDTTMRDAHQSLLATRMRTFDMTAAAKPTAQARSGFRAGLGSCGREGGASRGGVDGSAPHRAAVVGGATCRAALRLLV